MLLRVSGGLILWAVAFSLLYGLHGIGCAYGWNGIATGSANLFRAVMVGTWVVFILLGVGLVFRMKSRAAGLPARLGIASAWTGLAATIISGAPVAIASQCV